MERRISCSTSVKWGSPGMAIKCRTAQAISLQGWSSGLCAGWLFLWVVSTSLRRGIHFYASSYSAASSLLYFTAALLNLFRHYTSILQQDKQLFNDAAAQLGSEQETCLRLRWEAQAMQDSTAWCKYFIYPCAGLRLGQGRSGTCQEGLRGLQHWEREMRRRHRVPALLLMQDNNIYFYPSFFKENIIPRKLMWIRGKVSGLAL